MWLRLWVLWARLTARFHPCPLCGRWRGKPHPLCVLRVEDAMAEAGILDRPHIER